jgi:2-iminobutanoate/2-iminopropanoate deaminase
MYFVIVSINLRRFANQYGEWIMSRRFLLLLWVLFIPIITVEAGSAAEVEFYNDGPLKELGLPFSESVRVGDLLFLSGQIGGGADDKLVPGGIKPEAKQILLNIAATLEKRGLGMKDVVKCTVFLADISEWAAFNEVYVKHFSAPYPARSALGANGLALNARAEVECIAAY